MQTFHRFLESPAGWVRISGTGTGLSEVSFVEEAGNNDADAPELLENAARQLTEYFEGERQEFDLPLTLELGTAFQQKVWGELLKIPFGETRSYGQLARALGDLGASRAVGAANGQNPIAILVPCHRVIGASGKLTGYAGGMERKAWLLEHEHAAIYGRQAKLF